MENMPVLKKGNGIRLHIYIYFFCFCFSFILVFFFFFFPFGCLMIKPNFYGGLYDEVREFCFMCLFFLDINIKLLKN